jgi:hypothetical protein
MMKGNEMTEQVQQPEQVQNKINEQEFRVAVDQIIALGLNSLGPAVVLAQLSVSKRFVEVVYDTKVVEFLQVQQLQQKMAQQNQQKPE